MSRNQINDKLSQTYSDQRIARRDLKLTQDPNTIGELNRLIKHILSLDVPLGDGEHVVAPQTVAQLVGVGD